MYSKKFYCQGISPWTKIGSDCLSFKPTWAPNLLWDQSRMRKLLSPRRCGLFRCDQGGKGRGYNEEPRGQNKELQKTTC